MKQGWERKNLGDVFKLEYGKGLDKKFRSEDGFYPIYGANGIKGRTNKYYYDSETIIVGRKGSAGEITLTEEKFWPLDVTYFLTFDKNKYNLRFIYHLLRLLQLQKLAKGVKPGINRNDVYNIQAEFPPLEEQKRIVSILNKSFAAIDKAKANAEQNLKNSKELFESYLQSVFENKGDDWEEKTFKELSSRIGDGLHGTPKYDSRGDYFFINGNNLNDGVIEIKENTKRVGEKEYRKHLRPLTKNTVLISINGTLGKVAFYNNEPVILGKSACYINFDDRVEKRYIKYLVQSPIFFKNMTKESTGATIKNFSLKSMRGYKLAFPPMDIQKSIVKKLDKLSVETKKLESIYQNKIEDLEELKKSVLQKAFNGEL